MPPEPQEVERRLEEASRRLKASVGSDCSPQLRLDGGQDAGPVPAVRRAPYTAAQQEIMRKIAEDGQIRSIEAGVIVHAHRPRPCIRGSYANGDGEGCCRWASGDGGDALKRLAERGVVRRVGRGRWAADV